MSRKNKVTVDPQVEQRKSLDAVRTPSVGEQYLTNEATSLLDTIKAGDYTKRPKNVFFNYADPAARARQRELMMNAGPQGVYALGNPDPNLLALNRQNLDDTFARDTAAQTEQDWANAQARATAALGGIADLENAREGSALGSTTSSFNTKLAKPKWYEILAGGAQRAASAFP